MILHGTGLSISLTIMLALLRALGSAEPDVPALPDDRCVAPEALDGIADCQEYARCCGLAGDLAMECAYARADDRASCDCALGDRHVRCEEGRGAVACTCE